MEIREHPILFSAPMIRAILENRKSVTRRVVKPPKWSDAQHAGVDFGCPYGQPGDRLWIKETFSTGREDQIRKTKNIIYRASTPIPPENMKNTKWRSSRFMPRWASRITLEITGVRVERLQDISAKDVEAEGIDVVSKLPHPFSLTSKKSRENLDGLVLTIARGLYGNLWGSLNTKRGYGWDANPWIWVIEFKRIEGSLP